MIAVILEFDPIDGLENEFIASWIHCTQVIYKNFGSLGSRLHRSSDGKYIAYAQWPSKEVYAASADWPAHLVEARDSMRKLIKNGKPNVLHLLEVEADLLKLAPAPAVPL